MLKIVEGPRTKSSDSRRPLLQVVACFGCVRSVGKLSLFELEQCCGGSLAWIICLSHIAAQVKCNTSEPVFVTVKLMTGLTKKLEVSVTRQMYGVSEYLVSTIGAPDYVQNNMGVWMMLPYLNGGDAWSSLMYNHKQLR